MRQSLAYIIGAQRHGHYQFHCAWTGLQRCKVGEIQKQSFCSSLLYFFFLNFFVVLGIKCRSWLMQGSVLQWSDNPPFPHSLLKKMTVKLHFHSPPQGIWNYGDGWCRNSHFCIKIYSILTLQAKDWLQPGLQHSPGFKGWITFSFPIIALSLGKVIWLNGSSTDP